MTATVTLSGPTKVDLLVYRGDSGRFRVAVNDALGEPVNITGLTWRADIRIATSTPTTITEFEVEEVVGSVNKVDIILPVANSELLTNRCVYDIEMTDGTDVSTIMYGSISLTEDVSRA